MKVMSRSGRDIKNFCTTGKPWHNKYVLSYLYILILYRLTKVKNN
jgi:hypothetical protein